MALGYRLCLRRLSFELNLILIIYEGQVIVTHSMLYLSVDLLLFCGLSHMLFDAELFLY